jgi:hypothetical protein
MGAGECKVRIRSPVPRSALFLSSLSSKKGNHTRAPRYPVLKYPLCISRKICRFRVAETLRMGPKDLPQGAKESSRELLIAAVLRQRVYSGFGATMELVTAKMESAIRFSTPTLRISLATCAFTVRSSMPRLRAISRFDRAATRSLSTSVSRAVN